MKRFIESIQLHNGKVALLPYHQLRVDYTFDEHFSLNQAWKLSKILESIHLPEDGWFKIRVVYDAHNFSLDLYPYTPKPIRYLKVVNASNNIYPFKYEDRSVLNHLFKKKGQADDILISVNGLITDSSYANVILEKKGKLYTPKIPLLTGVQRQALLNKMSIEQADIEINDIPSFDRLYLINAMLPLGKLPPIPVSRIYLPKTN